MPGRIFKTKQISASGDTAIWTPATGKRWRLLGFHLLVPAHAVLASRNALTITFRDAAQDLGITFDVWCGQTAPVETASAIPQPLLVIPWMSMDQGLGISSAAVNNPLNLNLSAALSAGNIRVTVCGFEE